MHDPASIIACLGAAGVVAGIIVRMLMNYNISFENIINNDVYTLLPKVYNKVRGVYNVKER